MGKNWKQWQISSSWALKSLRIVTATMKLKDACSLEESYDKPRQHIKKQRHHFANKGPYSQSFGFSRSHVWMWPLDHKKGWALKNWCLWIVLLEKILESPLDDREVKSVNPKRSQPRKFIGRTDSEAETPILWPPDENSWLTGKDLDAGKDWRQKKRVAEDEMAGEHHWLSGHKSKQTPGDSEGQGSLAFCSPWGRSELDTT